MSEQRTSSALLHLMMGISMRVKYFLMAAGLASLFAAAASATDIPIDQVGQKFDPNKVSVKVGDKLMFHNSDDVTHNINVVDADDNNDDKGLQKPGETITNVFDKPGTYTVKCAIHQKMKMSVEVK